MLDKLSLDRAKNMVSKVQVPYSERHLRRSRKRVEFTNKVYCIGLIG